MFRVLLLIYCAFCMTTSRAQAEPVSEAQFQTLKMQVEQLTAVVHELKGTIDSQRAEIYLLRQSKEIPAASPVPAAPAARPAVSKILPDIGVVADIAFQADNPKEDAEGSDRISVRELEITLGSAVDPYSRFDATLGIADFEEMSIEEAYMTRFDLPLGATARLGRFMPRIGKSIPLHRDSLDTVDEPMVIEKYFGRHGYNKTGLDITMMPELPWDATHQLTFGVLEGGNGEEGTLFGDARRRPTIYSSLKNYIDWNDETGFELGFSHLMGSRDADGAFEVHVLGTDLTWLYRYADRRHIKLQGEAYHVSRSESFYYLENEDTGEFSFEDLDDARNLWGAYALLDARFHPQWAAGIRLDQVQPIETSDDFANPEKFENGISVYLTFYQSEFARWRVQYSHINSTSGVDDNRVFVQGVFAIGDHKHKIQ